MLYIHILTINGFLSGVKCALVCVFLRGNEQKKESRLLMLERVNSNILPISAKDIFLFIDI